MLRLTDEALAHVKNCAVPIPPWRRSDYLTAISSALAGVHDPSPAQAYKAARAAQQKILFGPRSNGDIVLDGRTGMPVKLGVR